MSFDGHEQSIEYLKSILQSDLINGLRLEQITKQTNIFGLNELPKKKVSPLKIYLAPLFNIMITIYVIAVIIYFFFSIWNANAFYEATTTFFLIAINFAVSVIQQYRSTKKIDALHKLSTPTCKVLRNGQLILLQSRYLVPGDIISIETGDRIPADARLLEVNGLEINESILTGESEPVEKKFLQEGLKKEIPIPERINMVFQGTYVQIGTGKALVVKTGSHTQIGKINDGLNEIDIKKIPLVKKINKIGFRLTFMMLLMLSISILIRLYDLWNSHSLGNIVLLSKYLTESLISTLSIIPINMPILITVILATGVFSMAMQKVVIKNLSSIESLGRISVLCSDKTGTITKGQMTASILYDNVTSFNVLSKGYDPNVSFVSKENLVIPEHELINIMSSPFSFIKENSNLEFILINSLLNNDSQIIIDDYLEVHGRSWKSTGNSTDAALLNLVNSTGLDQSLIRNRFSLIKSFPFDSRIKIMSKVFTTTADNNFICFTKGAIEFVLERCTKISQGNISSVIDLTEHERTTVLKKIDFYSSQGYRIISFAYKNASKNDFSLEDNRTVIEKELVYLGFICLLDPPREYVDQSVKELYSAGITPIMITGDSPATAVTIASKIGLFRHDSKYLQGSLTENYASDDFNKTVVYSRVSPNDKVEIIKRYQNQNRIVAMTGDGVNDALALTTADVGIAMGISGTELTKQSADMVISDDSYISIVTGIKEGRSLFYKVRVTIYFYLAVAITEGLIYFFTGLNPDFIVLSFWQKAYIFLLIHFLPPMALIFDRQSKDLMKQRPLDSADILNKNLITNLILFILTFFIILVVGYLIGNSIGITAINTSFFVPTLVDPSVKLSSLSYSLNQAKARTYFLTIIYITECLLVLSLRRMNMNIFTGTFKDGWWFVYFCSFFLLVTHVLVMYVPFIQEKIFSPLNIQVDIIALGPIDWIICLILGLIPILILELHKSYIRKSKNIF